MPNNHDALFRATFSEVEHARGVLRNVLPKKLTAQIDWSSLRLAAGEFVDAHLTERKTDLLFEVPLSGNPAYVFVIFEHQSTVVTMMASRMFTYVGRIWDRWRAAHPKAKRLPVVLPVVLYHGDGPWTAPTSLAALLDTDGARDPLALAPLLPQLQLFVADLGAHDEDALRAWAEASALARLVLLVFRGFQATDILEDLRRWQDLLRQAYKAPMGGQALTPVLRYILEEADVVPEAVETFVVDALGDEGREVYVTAAQRIREQGKAEGRAEGKAEGRAEGKAEGKAEIVARLLRLRFGELPPTVLERLRAADADQLDLWAERVIAASSLDAVFE